MDATPTADEPRPPRGVGSRRTLLIAGAAVLAVLIAIGAVFALRDDGDSSAQGGNSTSTVAGPDDATSTTRKPRTVSSTKPRTATTKKRAATATTVTTAGGAVTGQGSSATTPTTARNGPLQPVATPPKPGYTPVTTPQNIVDAYVGAFLDVCRGIWKLADADGRMVDIMDPAKPQLVLEDCTSMVDQDQADWYDTVEDARAWGRDDAIDTLDEIVWGRKLQNTSGTKTWTSPLSQ